MFANAGHAYMVVAGLRFDTSSMGSGGNGPRWRSVKRSPRGFAVRHPSGFYHPVLAPPIRLGLAPR